MPNKERKILTSDFIILMMAHASVLLIDYTQQLIRVALFHSVFNGLNTDVSRGWDTCVEWGKTEDYHFAFSASWQT